MSTTLIGSLTKSYTAAEVSAGKSPPLGYLYEDGKGKAWKFLKNNGATAITSRLVAVALTTEKSNNLVELAAATDALRPFAGVRPPSSDSMAQNESGYFQVAGSATFLHSGGQATAAEEGVVTSASVAGKVEGEATGPFTIASHPGVFAVAEAAKTLLDEVVTATIERGMYKP